MHEYGITNRYSLILISFLLLFFSQTFAMPIIAQSEKPKELQKKLQDALIKQGIAYKPRTEYLLANGTAKYTNRLLLENSPYLIQHAHNPVDWYPWGEDAFAKAKAEDKPIFLSIGYSTCHWCHVMERESFDNESIADFLNQYFISIKVDREQLPAVDSYYMTGVMMITGRGGWPMSNFLMSDGRPFYGATYYPPEQFLQFLQHIQSLWATEREQLSSSADKLSSAIAEVNSNKSNAQSINKQVIDRAVKDILQRYDSLNGGFSAAPKFPNEPSLLLLLRHLQRSADVPVYKALFHTLNEMAQGGIYDQIGGGFHRYSTDDQWLTPHFEKMLYNQAHLAKTYVQAYQLSGNSLHKRIARQTLDYLLREMKAPNGGFYSATDADSEGEEGLFFVWKEHEIKSILTTDQAKLAIDLYGISEAGNFEGHNILHLPQALDEYAHSKQIELSGLLIQVGKISTSLQQAREKKNHPFRDEKILTAWNGMVISTLAEAARNLNHPVYLDEAIQAADFLWQHNRLDSGRLFRTHLNGTASVSAAQEDYAYFAEALLRLFDATGDTNWLQKARQITDFMLENFWDKEHGGFFMAGQSTVTPQLLRLKEIHDGAIPSGNSVAIKVLAELEKRTGELTYNDKALATIAAFSEQIVANPSSYAYLMLGVDQLLEGETGDVQYAARGKVAVKAELEFTGNNSYKLKINLTIKPGWHINAHIPLQKELVATELNLHNNAKGWLLESTHYPEALQKKLKFQQSTLALYEGKVVLQSKIIRHNSEKMLLPVQITLQACNNKMCLAPEKLNLTISAVTTDFL